MKPRSRRAASLAALLGLLFVTTPVEAALFLELDPVSGPPGVVVVGRTGGIGSLAGSVDLLPTYLVQSAQAGAIATSDDPRLVAIGAVVVDEAGDGRLTFEVPAVQPGRYTVLVRCDVCAPTSAGRTMLPVADFGVEATVPPTDTIDALEPDRYPIEVILSWFAGVIGCALAELHRTGRRSVPPS